MKILVIAIQFLLIIIFFSKPISSSTQVFKIPPGFRGSQMNFIDNNGLFLLSNNSNFAFGFVSNKPQSTDSFDLSIIHQGSSTVVWTANVGRAVGRSDEFVFGKDGNAYVSTGGETVWATNTSNKGGALEMELLNTGNLVVYNSENSGSDPVWQSFGYPTDTLLSNQSFDEGMKLFAECRFSC
ncbi:uncharacterized protein A4U43_C01F24860 [Asparagus officinalis]|uniref:Bulb-type lectin domain-containing protein n=1 Tax=Asparagus officinalis TaxID=4686 RepID=A0A5P1FRX8_ASPOF|nr:uncharacterized protein A4U43_C01F24860 [Asparagus officinalis]